GAAHRLGRECSPGSLDQQVDARPRRRAICPGQRHLLADNRRQVAVKGQDKLLDVPPSPVRIDQREPARQQRLKYLGGQEPKEGVDRAVIGKPEAADLVTLESAVARQEEVDLGIAKHPNLGVQVAKVWNLEDLVDPLEARVAARPKESL